MKYGVYIINNNYNGRKEFLTFLPNYIRYGCVQINGYYKFLCHCPKARRHKHLDLSGLTHQFMKQNPIFLTDDPAVVKVFKDDRISRQFGEILEERLNLNQGNIINIVKTLDRLARKKPFTYKEMVKNYELNDFAWFVDQKNIEMGGKSHW